MIVLGLSSDFHDSSAAILVDGEIVASVAEERLSYQKHDPSFPSLAIDACLERAKIKADEVDCVAYHEDPPVKFSRVLATNLARFPRDLRGFARSSRELILGQMWVKLDIVRKLGIDPRNIHYVPHHLSHAAYAFLTSGFSSASVLVVDAVGEWTSTSGFHARIGQNGLKVEPTTLIPYPHSLGLLYSVFTGFLGFKVNDGECSTMALASFGRPRYEDRVRNIIREAADGTYELDLDFFDFSDPKRIPVSKKFTDLFGAPRDSNDPLPFASTSEIVSGFEVSERHTYYADIAASVQKVLEDTVIRLASSLRAKDQEKNLCFAGGVALNCSLNGRLIRENLFENIYVPPDPGDGGGALGAALYVDAITRKASAPREGFHPFYGISYPEQSAVETAMSLDISEARSRRHLPTSLPRFSRLAAEHLTDRASLIERTVTALQAGRIVGWFQGGFENGPRALGHRSLLADPRDRKSAQRLSTNIKLRAAFRPYACSIAEEDAEFFFPNIRGRPPPAMRWMSSAHAVRSESRARITQALHIDGSTRPQIVSQTENPLFHGLLSAWRQVSGSAALLNTSFNESGYPLVSSPIDALLMFLRTDIEVLVLNNTIITKR